MKVITGSSNPLLAQQLAQQLGVDFIQPEISKFGNGEKRVRIKEQLLGENVILVQSFSEPVDELVMEFLLLTDALERQGVRHVNAVIPWLGYSLQDKMFRSGEPIAAKVIANLVSNAYVKRAFLLDLHNSSTPGFFSIPSAHLSALPLFSEYARKEMDMSQIMVASPDFGGLKRARLFAEELGVELAKIDKHRDLDTGTVSVNGLQGDVKGKTVVLFDDVIMSGSTVVKAAETLKEEGATKVYFFATHGPLVQTAFELLERSDVDKVVVTNSILHTKTSPKFEILDAAPIFAAALKTWS